VASLTAAAPEALFPAAQRLAGRARGAGVRVTFSPVADSVHSFILFDFLPEASRAVAEFAAFAHQDSQSSLDSDRAGRQAGDAGHRPADGDELGRC
jgi:hypothetical protein